LNDGGDALRDRDRVDEIILEECCLVNEGDSDRDLIEITKNYCNEKEENDF
jgi:hypothetical protein